MRIVSDMDTGEFEETEDEAPDCCAHGVEAYCHDWHSLEAVEEWAEHRQTFPGLQQDLLMVDVEEFLDKMDSGWD